MFTDDEIDEIRNYLSETPGRIYLGCDSQKYKSRDGQWYARYTTVLIVHIHNSRGGKIFKTTDRELDYDQKRDKPRLRLMNEVYRVSSTYVELGDLLEEREVEIHLDINPDLSHNSSIVIKEALGYVQGVTGIKAKVKPDAFAASRCADAGVRGRWNDNYPNKQSLRHERSQAQVQ